MTTALTTEQQLAIARLEGILEGSGLSLEQVQWHLQGVETVAVATTGSAGTSATIASLVGTARQALPPGTVRTYGTYWSMLVHGIRLPGHWDDEQVGEWTADARAANTEKGYGLTIDTSGSSFRRCVDDAGDSWMEITAGFGDRHPRDLLQSEVQVVTKWVRVNALATLARENRKRRAEGRPEKEGHGKGAVENFLAATRCLYNLAAGDGIVLEGYNPAAKVKKPKRQRTKVRRSMTDQELDDVWVTTTTTGYDPELDENLHEFHADTGARPEGAINLKLKYLIRDGYFEGRRYRNVIVLDQKGDKVTVVPVRGSLIDKLETFAQSRGSIDPDDPVFRYRRRDPETGALAPLTEKRYETWGKRVKAQHAWAAEAEWSPYWFRHHAAEQVEAWAGRDAKRLFLGHEPDGVTDVYGQSDYVHVAWAVEQLTGEPHPDAQPPTRGPGSVR